MIQPVLPRAWSCRCTALVVAAVPDWRIQLDEALRARHRVWGEHNAELLATLNDENDRPRLAKPAVLVVAKSTTLDGFTSLHLSGYHTSIRAAD